MRWNKIIGLMLFSMLLLGSNVCAQDVHFSQFYANPLYLNPALAGSAVCPRLAINYRHQWPSVSGKYTSYAASYDQHFNAISGGVGVLFLGDRAASGAINTNAVSLIYSFKADLTRKVSMRLALQATFQQKTLNFDKFTYGDMIDPKYGFVYQTQENIPRYTRAIADFSAGLVFYSDNIYGGLAVNHFTQPRESFFDNGDNDTRLPLKLTAHFGANIKLKARLKKTKSIGDMSLSPNIIFQFQNKISGGYAYSTLNYGMYYTCYPMILGLWFRQGFKNPDALIFLAGVHYDFFKIGYSYDFTIPHADKPNTGGSHEISAQFELPCPQKSRRVRHINCPKF